jgi:hypothetical protein
MKFLKLGLKHVPKLPRQQRIENQCRVPSSRQKCNDGLLVLLEVRKASGVSRKLRRKIDMEAGGKSVSIREFRCTLRVRHEHHCARGADPLESGTGENPVRSDGVSAVIIRVNDQHDALTMMRFRA